MQNVKKKCFTLIELIAVLVIMAILVLISPPLVMNIIRKARTASDKRSIDAYGGISNDAYGCPYSDISFDKIKKTIVAWTSNNINLSAIKSSRIISYDDLINNLGYTYAAIGTSMVWKNTEDTPSWVYDNDYWTITKFEDSIHESVWVIRSDGKLDNYNCDGYGASFKLRPVVELYKSALN